MKRKKKKKKELIQYEWQESGCKAYRNLRKFPTHKTRQKLGPSPELDYIASVREKYFWRRCVSMLGFVTKRDFVMLAILYFLSQFLLHHAQMLWDEMSSCILGIGTNCKNLWCSVNGSFFYFSWKLFLVHYDMKSPTTKAIKRFPLAKGWYNHTAKKLTIFFLLSCWSCFLVF